MNIFLTKSRDHIKIGDFGISKILTSKSKAITVVGTPNYISPELCEGKPYNQKSDIWALGCILYEMCTLKHPFEAPTLPALVLKIMRGTFNPLPAHYSTNLRDLLSSLLAVDPNQRPSLIQIMGHNWIAPYLYKLPTTLGRLACTAKPARPLSVAMTRHQQDNNFLLPRQEVENPRSPSPFSRGSRIATSIFKISLHGSGSATKLELPSKNSSCEQLEDICSVSHGMSLGTTREGLVLEWTKSKQPRILEGKF